VAVLGAEGCGHDRGGGVLPLALLLTSRLCALRRFRAASGVGVGAKTRLLLGTGTRPHRSVLKSIDLTSAPATTTLVAAVATRGLLAASRAGNPAVAVARSIGGGKQERAWRKTMPDG